MNVIMNQPTLRRSNRLIAKNRSLSKSVYIKHIQMLHSVAFDLLPMAPDVSVDTLQKIIANYENIIGGLLTNSLLDLHEL
jgi:hypothetical protein